MQDKATHLAAVYCIALTVQSPEIATCDNLSLITHAFRISNESKVKQGKESQSKAKLLVGKVGQSEAPVVFL